MRTLIRYHNNNNKYRWCTSHRFDSHTAHHIFELHSISAEKIKWEKKKNTKQNQHCVRVCPSCAYTLTNESRKKKKRTVLEIHLLEIKFCRSDAREPTMNAYYSLWMCGAVNEVSDGRGAFLHLFLLLMQLYAFYYIFGCGEKKRQFVVQLLGLLCVFPSALFRSATQVSPLVHALIHMRVRI